MKCCLIVGVLILATLLPDETLAGRKPFKFGSSKPGSRGPSPRNDPAHRRPSSTAVTPFTPQTSNFARRPPASSSTSHHPSRPTSPGRSPSPGPRAPFERLPGSTTVKPNTIDKGSKNTFKDTQHQRPTSHHSAAQDHRPGSSTSHQAAQVHRPDSPVPPSRSRSTSPKPPLNQLNRGRTAEKTSQDPSIPGEKRPSRSKSEAQAAHEKVDFPMIDDFAKRVEVIAPEKGFDAKQVKQKQQTAKNVKKNLKYEEKQAQQPKPEDKESRRHRSLERISVLKHENRDCSTEKSADYACFDYYGFALYWPPTSGFAQKKKNTLSDHNRAKLIDDWVIHGLWPSTYGRNKDQPVKQCNVKSMSFDKRKLKPIIHDLEKLWFSSMYPKDETFWKHEFDEHGSCAVRSVSINDVLGYFKMGINLRRKIDLSRTLEVKGFRKGATMTYRDIYNAISEKYAKPHIETTKDLENDKTYLSEIKICLNHRFKFIDCKSDKLKHMDIWENEISYLSKDEI